jgi:hypothetical protein
MATTATLRLTTTPDPRTSITPPPNMPLRIRISPLVKIHPPLLATNSLCQTPDLVLDSPVVPSALVFPSRNSKKSSDRDKARRLRRIVW